MLKAHFLLAIAWRVPGYCPPPSDESVSQANRGLRRLSSNLFEMKTGGPQTARVGRHRVLRVERRGWPTSLPPPRRRPFDLSAGLAVDVLDVRGSAAGRPIP
jgi:hypothetical protein